jgi:hypothetical protein
MSAVAPIASEFVCCTEMTLSAKTGPEQVQQTAEPAFRFHRRPSCHWCGACYSSPIIETNSSTGMRGMSMVYSTELVSA